MVPNPNLDGSKTEPMKTRVTNAGPRIIPLSPNGNFGVPDRWQQNGTHEDPCRQHWAQNHPVEPQWDDWCARSGINGRKTEPMKARVANTGPRIIPLSPNGMFGVSDLESIAAKHKS